MEPFGVLLGDYAYMSNPPSAQNWYGYLTGEKPPQMPIGGPYSSAEQLQLSSRWMSGGFPR